MGTLHNFSGHDLGRMPSVARGEARVHRARCVRATAENLAGYGFFVDRLDPADVEIVPWPVSGRRPLVPGTGNEGGVTRGAFVMQRRGGCVYAHNHAVERAYLTGWFGDPADARDDDAVVDRTRLLTHEANYHPDGGQIFVPRERAPFVALLALPGDDVTLDDFVAFWCDGSRGLGIHPGVWHQPLFPCADRLVFDDAQGRVHACVSVDFLGEFGAYVEVGLTDPGA